MSRPHPRRRIRALGWPISPRREVDEEIAAHLELQAHRFERAGMPPDAARAEALRRFGDVTRVRDECRTIREHMEVEMRSSELLGEVRQDLVVALRGFARQPLFTAAVLLTLAIGIGANVTVFSVVDAVLLRALPYRHAERVVTVWNGYGASGLDEAAVSPPEVADIAAQTRAFDGVAAVSSQASSLADETTGEPERLDAYVVSPHLFTLLGTAPVVGRGFTADDGQAGAPRVVILSHALWQRRFGGDPRVVGRTVTMAGVPRTIVGVMPANVRFPDAPLGFLRERGAVWFPFDWNRARDEDRGNQYLAVLARLRPGMTAGDAQRDLDAISARFRTAVPDRYAPTQAPGWRLLAVPMHTKMLGAVRPTLVVIAGAVGLVLLIACVNVANLLLARGAGRVPETAVRVALGARRGRVVRQLLTESAALATAGGALGVGLAWLGLRLVLRLDPSSVPRLDDARLDGPALLFSLGASALTGVLFGLLPSLRHSRVEGSTALVGSRGATAGRRHSRLRAALVALEVGMATVVLVGAALLGHSFAGMRRAPLGFDPVGVLTAQLTLPARQYDSLSKVVAFQQQLTSALGELPDVDAATGVYPLPTSGDGWGASFAPVGYPKDGPAPHAEHAVALPNYFRAARIPLLSGRDFTSDDRKDAPLVVIVDDVLARRYWPGERAVGKRVELLGASGSPVATVVGVVGHVRNGGPRAEGEPQLYMPFLQRPQRTMSLVLRANLTRVGEPGALAPSLRAGLRALDATLPLARVGPMKDVVARAVARERFDLILVGVFGAAALLLAAVGLYGVMAYLVAQRTREVGIRIALGGQPRDVRRLVVQQGLAIAGVGLLGGIAAALVLARSLTSLLFGVKPADPATYAAIVVLLLGVAFVAAWLPARRATRIDPVTALRA